MMLQSPLAESKKLIVISVAIYLYVATSAPAVDQRTTTVGMTARIEQLVLPGSEIEVKPLEDRKAPVVVRIDSVDKHGTAHRYNIVYYTLEPGTFDLRDYLRRKDGTPLGAIPELKVTATSLLPKGQVLPHDVVSQSPPWMGGYTLLLILAATVWILGLAAIIFLGRRKPLHRQAIVAPQTLADRLRPLVAQGIAGTLEPAQRAELERSLLGYWTKRLDLRGVKPIERFAKLREHSEAGPLLVELENWLHRPGSHTEVDVTKLLRPYENIPADALNNDSDGVAP